MEQCEDGGMADDDIEALLREVEASLGTPKPSSSSPAVPERSAVAPAPKAEITDRSGGSRLPAALVAGAVAGGGMWLGITLLSGLQWLAVVIAFVVGTLAWLARD